MGFPEVVPPHHEMLKGLQKLMKVLMSVDWKGTGSDV